MQSLSTKRLPLSALMHRRALRIKAMLKQQSPHVFQDQKHLDEGSAERSYWNYGYLSALEDILKKISTDN